MTGQLSEADLYDWITLRRVSDGGVTRQGNRWMDHGRRVPGYLTDALAALCHTGLVTLTGPPPGDLARAVLTDTGTARYEQLCQSALGLSAAQFTALCGGHGENDPNPWDAMPPPP